MKTEVIKVHPEFPEIDKIAKCAKAIRKGGLVVFPTETVYGVAADFNNKEAIKRLREVKKRSEDKPFSILISEPQMITNYGVFEKNTVFKLIHRYWPGPLTVVVPTKDETTIGIRVPNHIVALKFIQEVRSTIVAPSANFEGNEAPKTCQEALRDLDGLVDIAIDGGEVLYGQGSTVVDLSQEKPVVLREGVIKKEDILKVAEKKTVLFVCTGNSCRSVMAEYLLKDACKAREDVDVFSAGTGVYIRSTASLETLAALHKRGVDASAHVSQPLDPVLIKQADLILVMTKLHRQIILDKFPEVQNQTYLLREFANEKVLSEASLDIPDPIGKPASAYEECILTIQSAIDKIVTLI